MKFSKSIVLAALLGSMTFTDVQSVQIGTLHKHRARIEPGSIAQQVAVEPTPAPAPKPAPAKKAVVAPPKSVEATGIKEAAEIINLNAGKPLTASQEKTVTKKVTDAQQDLEIKQAKQNESQDVVDSKIADKKAKEFAEETEQIVIKKKNKKTPEQQAEELKEKLDKIAEESKALKKERVEEGLSAKLKERVDKEKRDWDRMDSYEAVVKGDKAEVLKEAKQTEETRQASRLTTTHLDDEEWVANMPKHILKGYEHLPHHPESLVEIEADAEAEDEDSSMPAAPLDVTQAMLDELAKEEAEMDKKGSSSLAQVAAMDDAMNDVLEQDYGDDDGALNTMNDDDDVAGGEEEDGDDESDDDEEDEEDEQPASSKKNAQEVIKKAESTKKELQDTKKTQEQKKEVSKEAKPAPKQPEAKKVEAAKPISKAQTASKEDNTADMKEEDVADEDQADDEAEDEVQDENDEEEGIDESDEVDKLAEGVSTSKATTKEAAKVDNKKK